MKIKISYENILYFIFLFSFAFDFRGQEGGSSIQLVFVAINAIAAILILIRFKKRYFIRKNFMVFVSLMGMLILFSFIPPLLGRVPLQQYIRIIYPYILILVTFIIVYRRISLSNGIGAIFNSLIVVSTVSVLFRAVYGFLASGIDISSIRYQILSPAATFLIAAALSQLFFGKRNSIYIVLCGLIALLSVFLSVTRGVLFGVVLMFLAAAFISLSSFGGLIVQKKFRTAIFSFFAILSISFLIAVFVPSAVESLGDIYQRWIFRSTGRGSSITLYSRLSQIKSQLDMVNNSYSNMIFGVGYGANYFWDRSYMYLVRGYFTYKEFTTAYWYPGENTWVYSIFASGFVVGIAVPVIYMYAILRSVIIFLRYRINKYNEVYLKTAFLCLIGYMGQSFTANIFGERLSGIIIGCMFAFIFSMFDNIKNYQRRN